MNPSKRKTNNIYILENIDPNYPRYDVSTAFVVIAKDIKQARKLVTEKKITGTGTNWYRDEGKERWLDSKRSSCKLIGWTILKPQVIMNETIDG